MGDEKQERGEGKGVKALMNLRIGRRRVPTRARLASAASPSMVDESQHGRSSDLALRFERHRRRCPEDRNR